MAEGSARVAALEELRDLVKAQLTAKDASPSAALVRQYRDTLREIDELKRGTKKGSLVDELAKRRQTRGTATTSRTQTRKRKAQQGS